MEIEYRIGVIMMQGSCLSLTLLLSVSDNIGSKWHFSLTC
uniref:Uncharacterized protein n=1 Tax=Rhizophora mucronata TaxID=61149 RepID=A0A2P2IZ79_RHIMU